VFLCSWAIAVSSAIGSMVPISLLASMIDAKIVSGLRAFLNSSGVIMPSLSTSRYVTWYPSFSSCLNGWRTASCSTFVVIM